MKTMKLGKTGIDISRMGLGTWSIGGGSAWGGDHDLQVVVDTIREAPKLGVNLYRHSSRLQLRQQRENPRQGLRA